MKNLKSFLQAVIISAKEGKEFSGRFETDYASVYGTYQGFTFDVTASREGTEITFRSENLPNLTPSIAKTELEDLANEFLEIVRKSTTEAYSALIKPLTADEAMAVISKNVAESSGVAAAVQEAVEELSPVEAEVVGVIEVPNVNESIGKSK